MIFLAVIQALILVGIMLFLILVIGVPVAFSIGFICVFGICAWLDPVFFIQLGNTAYNQATSDNQLLVPLFLLMAELLTISGIAGNLYEVLSKWMRKLKGGLGIAAIAATTIFAALCGSSQATAAAIGRVSVNEMKQRGWSEELAVGIVAAGGTTGIMIPPSLTLAFFGILTETSIVKLFIAGVIPGLINTALFVAYILYRGLRHPEDVGSFRKGQPIPDTVKYVENPYAGSDGKKEFLKDLGMVAPPLLLIVIIFVCLYTGTTTPSEMGAVGSVLVLLMVIIYGKMRKGIMTKVFFQTSRVTVMNMTLVIAGLCFSFVLSCLGLTQQMAVIVTSTITNKWVCLIFIYLLWLVLGCLVDAGSMTLLTIPFAFPILTAYGFDPIWLGIVNTLCCEIGMITPPVGMNLFILSSTCDIDMSRVIKGALPFVLILLFSLVLLTVFPGITQIMIH